MDPAQDFLAFAAECKALAIKPGQIRRRSGRRLDNLQPAPDNPKPELSLLSVLVPNAPNRQPCFPCNHDRTVRSRHLMEQRWHESRVSPIVRSGKPWVRRPWVGVDGDYRQFAVACWPNNAVQHDGIKSQLVATPNEISFGGHFDQVAREQHFAALQLFG